MLAPKRAAFPASRPQTQTGGPSVRPLTLPFAATAGTGSFSELGTGGCFVVGNSVLTPPWAGHYGNMGRNIFRDSGFKDVDFSVFKDFKFRERFGAEFPSRAL